MNDADDGGQARRRGQPGHDGGLKAFHGLIAELEGTLPLLQEDDRREIEPYLKALLACVRRLAPAALRGTVDGEPMRMLTASELGAELGGIGDEMVRLREQRGQLFSILPSGRQRGRRYPAFQAWPGIAGRPLNSILGKIASHSDEDRWDFFAQRHPQVHWLTPVEVLVGDQVEEREISPEALRLLRAPADDRLRAVIAAAPAPRLE